MAEPLNAGEIYDLYAYRIYRYVFHRLGDRSLAEDLTSEVFVRLVRARAQPDNVLAYLYRTAHNLVVDYLRRNPALLAPIDDLLGSNRDDPARITQLEAERARLRWAISRLKPEQEQVIVLRFLEGLSNAEVAVILGKPEGAVKALQHRALVRLRYLLGGHSRELGSLEFAGLLE
ncbi:MAG: sigma-70 family RNA polymerase sigma factor [Rudaea sp.]